MKEFNDKKEVFEYIKKKYSNADSVLVRGSSSSKPGENEYTIELPTSKFPIGDHYILDIYALSEGGKDDRGVYIYEYGAQDFEDMKVV